MNTYNLIQVEEYILNGHTTTIFKVPVDNNGNYVEYSSKNRVIQDDQMIVFDTEEEYRNWLISNS